MNQDKKHKYLSIYGYGTLILAFSFLALCLFWLLYPYKTTTYFDTPYKIGKPIVRQGEDTTYTATYCKYTEVKPMIQKEFIDGIVFRAEEKRAEFAMGCNTSVIKLHIPETLPPGRYKLRATAVYQMNPIRTIEKVNETEWFEVIQATEGAYGLDKIK